MDGRDSGAGAGGGAGRWKVIVMGGGAALGKGKAWGMLVVIGGGAWRPVALNAQLAARLASKRHAASYHPCGL